MQRELPRPPAASSVLIRNSLIRTDEKTDNEKKKGVNHAANRKSLPVPVMEDFEEDKLKEAYYTIKEEAQFVSVTMGHETKSLDEFVEAHKTCLHDITYFPTRNAYSLSSVAGNLEKLTALQNEFENLKKRMDDNTKKEQRLEQKIKVLTNSYRQMELLSKVQTLLSLLPSQMCLGTPFQSIDETPNGQLDVGQMQPHASLKHDMDADAVKEDATPGMDVNLLSHIMPSTAEEECGEPTANTPEGSVSANCTLGLSVDGNHPCKVAVRNPPELIDGMETKITDDSVTGSAGDNLISIEVAKEDLAADYQQNAMEYQITDGVLTKLEYVVRDTAEDGYGNVNVQVSSGTVEMANMHTNFCQTTKLMKPLN